MSKYYIGVKNIKAKYASIFAVSISLLFSACGGGSQYIIADKRTDPNYKEEISDQDIKNISSIPKVKKAVPKSRIIDSSTGGVEGNSTVIASGKEKLSIDDNTTDAAQVRVNEKSPLIGYTTVPDAERSTSNEVITDGKAISQDESTPREEDAIEIEKKPSIVDVKDTRINTVRKYSAYWAGLHVGDMINAVESEGVFLTDKNEIKAQKFTTIIRTHNLAKLISGYKSTTKALMSFNENGEYKPSSYSTSYKIRKKHRDITMKYSADGSTIIEETNMPPEKRWKRKEVPSNLKVNSPDPLTLIFQIREKIRHIVEKGGRNTFTLPLYDGRRRSNYFFTVYGITKNNLIHITFEEKPVSGYTNNELKDFKKGTTLVTVYLAKDDLLPVWAKAHSFLGTAKILLKKYCKTLEECLD